VNVAQSDIQTLPLVVQSGSIFRGVCHLRPFFFNSSQLLSDFLSESVALAKCASHTEQGRLTSCSASRCFRQTSASKTAWIAGVSSPII
jgi:hypothetical protein